MPSSMAREAATSSWVDRGLEAEATTVAPPAFSVRSRLAVSVVMCRQAAMVTPSSGRSFSKRARMLASTGMWLSAHAMRWRPSSASEASAKSPAATAGGGRGRLVCHSGVVPSGLGVIAWVHVGQVVGGIGVGAARSPAEVASALLIWSWAGMGPGSTPSCRASWIEVTSPTRIRSRSWASSPSPSAVHLLDAGHDLVEQPVGELEAVHDLRVLEVVAQPDQGDDLAGDVAVLAPSRELVVAQLGLGVPEGGDLGVLVHAATSTGRRRPLPARPHRASRGWCGRWPGPASRPGCPA